MYCTKANLIDRFSEDELIDLTDRTNTGVIDDAVLDQAISDAQATIDGYLASRYSLPIASVPAVLVRLSCDIARYFLYDERLDAEHQAAKRYADTIRFLEKVGKGELGLGLTSEQNTVETNDTAQITSAGSVFNRPGSKGFI